jgi:hypothetical protein
MSTILLRTHAVQMANAAMLARGKLSSGVSSSTCSLHVQQLEVAAVSVFFASVHQAADKLLDVS